MQTMSEIFGTRTSDLARLLTERCDSLRRTGPSPCAVVAAAASAQRPGLPEQPVDADPAVQQLTRA